MTVRFRIPATTANLGIGFDSIGLALSLYLTVEAERAERWAFALTGPNVEGLPTDETNLVAVAAVATAERYEREMPPLFVRVASGIPLTHGLGSSAAAIAAGVLLANWFCDLQLDKKRAVAIASELEGHPDNAGAALLGGLFVGCSSGGLLEFVELPAPEVACICTVPPYPLATSEARRALPAVYPREEAVMGSAVANVAVAALAAGNWKAAGRLMGMDRFHEPYRRPLIPEYERAKEAAFAGGAYATVISGAGPTLMTFAPQAEAPAICAALRRALPACDSVELPIDARGAVRVSERQKEEPIW